MVQADQAVLACRVRRALENTCQVIEQQKSDAVLTYGRGLLQVPYIYMYTTAQYVYYAVRDRLQALHILSYP